MIQTSAWLNGIESCCWKYGTYIYKLGSRAFIYYHRDDCNGLVPQVRPKIVHSMLEDVVEGSA